MDMTPGRRLLTNSPSASARCGRAVLVLPLLLVWTGCNHFGQRPKDDPFLGSVALQQDAPFQTPKGGQVPPPPRLPATPATHALTSQAVAAGQTSATDSPSPTPTGAGTTTTPAPVGVDPPGSKPPSGAILAPPQPLDNSTS